MKAFIFNLCDEKDIRWKVTITSRMDMLKLWSRPNLVPSRPRRFPMSHDLSRLSGNSRHCTRFQASSTDSDSANWRGDEAGQDRLSLSAEAQMGTPRVSADAKIGWYRFIMFPGKKPEDKVHWVY